MILSGIVEKKRILLLLLLVISFSAGAQQFGGNPPSIKWKQVNTDTARIIFPSGLEQQAREVSEIVHRLATLTRPTIGSSTKKIDIVLQPLPTTANGYVSLGPFRSEFFLTPRQNSFELGSLPWHKTLALHEYRHVQQYSNFRKGLSKAFYVVFGQEGQALANSLTIPDWFYEGDAVYQETFMSDQGRGRLPYFFNDYRSLWSSGKNYSWMKLRNGSYRDLVPNHYQLGYMLTAYGYEKYGDSFWRNVSGDAAAFKRLFYPFQKAVKKYSGKSFREFTDNAISYFKYESGKRDNQFLDSAAVFGKKNKHFVANEEYPHFKNDSTIILVKSDFKRIPEFYEKNINTGVYKKIKTKSISNDNYFSYNNGKIVYSAYEPDPRWRWKNYEVIKVIDVNSGEERKVTSRTRYLSPDISPDGKTIVAVPANPSNTNSLHFIDAVTGEIISKISEGGGFFFTYPKFINDHAVVSAVRDEKGQMLLGVFDLEVSSIKWLTPRSTLNVIGFPQVYKDTVAFSMSDGRQDKLFISTDGKVFRFDPDIQNTSTGNYQLTQRDGRYAWTSFTSAGFQVVNGTGKFTEVNVDNNENNFYPLSKLRQPSNVIADTSVRQFPIQKYSSSYRLFNFHSWRPYFADPDYSYSLISQNVLNTLQSEIYFTYNRNERFKETGASLSYAGWFPVLTAGGAFTFDRSFTDSSRVINWNEFNAVARVSVPLSFASGTFFQNINFAGAINTKQVYYTGASKQDFDDKRFNYLEWTVSGSNQQIKARQNIYPRFAQTFLARYRHIINNYTANQLLLTGSLYFPGLARNHNIVLQAAYQRRDTLQQYTFTNSFPFSRGYTDVDLPRMWKVGGNYHFPIAYPDAGFGNIVYLLRLRGNVFYDYSEIKSLRSGRTLPFRTAGAELYFDTKWWNQLPLSFGFRYNRLLDGDVIGLAANQYEIILPMDLLSR